MTGQYDVVEVTERDSGLWVRIKPHIDLPHLNESKRKNTILQVLGSGVVDVLLDAEARRPKVGDVVEVAVGVDIIRGVL